MFGLSSLTTYLIIGGVVLVLVAGAVGYFKWSQWKIGDLIGLSVQQELVIEAQKEVIIQKEEDAETTRAIQRTIEETRQSNQEGETRTQGRLNEQDIGRTAREDPALAETIVNREMKFRNRCFEIATGSKVTILELSVPLAERNNVCPQLFGYPSP